MLVVVKLLLGIEVQAPLGPMRYSNRVTVVSPIVDHVR